MSKKIKYGYFRKVNLIGQTLNYYSYGAILFDLQERVRLYGELTGNQNLKLFCACSEFNDREIRITNTYGFDFQAGIEHHPYCINNIRRLSKFIIRNEISPFIGNAGSIPVSFRWKKGCRSASGFIGPAALYFNQTGLSLSSLVAIMNIRAFKKCVGKGSNYPTELDFFNEVSFEMGRYILSDSKGDQIALTSTSMYQPSQKPGSISFIYARIINYDESYKSKVYIGCSYSYGKTNICIDKEKWDFLKANIIPDVPLYVAGFVVTKEVSVFVKGRYDSKTHTAYKASEQKKRIENVLSSFVLFHANNHGLLCFTKEEYWLGNYLCNKNIIYEKPYYPMPCLSSPLPLLFIPREGEKDCIYGNVTSENYHSLSKEDLLKLSNKE